MMNEKAEILLINFSHKFRNRVSVVLGLAQMLENDIGDPKEIASSIIKECNSLNEEIKKSLSLSRLEFVSPPLSLKPLPVTEILDNCLDRFSGVRLQKDLSFKINKDREEIFVLGDEDYLEEILENLLSNALRYAEREILVTVKTDRDLVALTVEDDGRGLEEEALPHLFDRFYKGPDGNFGLGLAIAKESAEKLGGSLSAANRPEGGAVFTLTLPAAR